MLHSHEAAPGPEVVTSQVGFSILSLYFISYEAAPGSEVVTSADATTTIEQGHLARDGSELGGCDHVSKKLGVLP